MQKCLVTFSYKILTANVVFVNDLVLSNSLHLQSELDLFLLRLEKLISLLFFVNPISKHLISPFLQKYISWVLKLIHNTFAIRISMLRNTTNGFSVQKKWEYDLKFVPLFVYQQNLKYVIPIEIFD